MLHVWLSPLTRATQRRRFAGSLLPRRRRRPPPPHQPTTKPDAQTTTAARGLGRPRLEVPQPSKRPRRLGPKARIPNPGPSHHRSVGRSVSATTHTPGPAPSGPHRVLPACLRARAQRQLAMQREMAKTSGRRRSENAGPLSCAAPLSRVAGAARRRGRIRPRISQAQCAAAALWSQLGVGSKRRLSTR